MGKKLKFQAISGTENEKSFPEKGPSLICLPKLLLYNEKYQ